MDHTQRLQVFKTRKQLNGKSSDEAVVEALVVVHLNKLIEINRVEVKYEAEMVAEHEVVSQLDHPL